LSLVQQEGKGAAEHLAQQTAVQMPDVLGPDALRIAASISGEPPGCQDGAKTQLISSLIASWLSKIEQTQAQSSSEPTLN